MTYILAYSLEIEIVYMYIYFFNWLVLKLFDYIQSFFLKLVFFFIIHTIPVKIIFCKVWKKNYLCIWERLRFMAAFIFSFIFIIVFYIAHHIIKIHAVCMKYTVNTIINCQIMRLESNVHRKYMPHMKLNSLGTIEDVRYQLFFSKVRKVERKGEHE
ncbi:hypothetical protein KUTeg_016471, partial [Tegillarca granosa]